MNHFNELLVAFKNARAVYSLYITESAVYADVHLRIYTHTPLQVCFALFNTPLNSSSVSRVQIDSNETDWKEAFSRVWGGGGIIFLGWCFGEGQDFGGPILREGQHLPALSPPPPPPPPST